MNDFPSNIGDFIAAYGPAFSDYSTVYSSVESQSASAISSDMLWKKTLVDVIYEVQEKPLTIPREKADESVDLPPVNQAAIELLRRWREEDEQVSDDQDGAQKLPTDSSAISIEDEPSQGVVLSPESQELIQVLRSWRENDEDEDAEEQRTTWEYLKQALDEDRISDRKLFPEHEITSEQVEDINNECQFYPEKEPNQGVV